MQEWVLSCFFTRASLGRERASVETSPGSLSCSSHPSRPGCSWLSRSAATTQARASPGSGTGTKPGRCPSKAAWCTFAARPPKLTLAGGVWCLQLWGCCIPHAWQTCGSMGSSLVPQTTFPACSPRSRHSDLGLCSTLIDGLHGNTTVGNYFMQFSSEKEQRSQHCFITQLSGPPSSSA